ncbi:MAG TPA: hypothetical protein DEQ32_01755 [Gammaproteobacteria bacterium]|nr:hypothetical protein [Gammaproteobacteria bacterium]
MLDNKPLIVAISVAVLALLGIAGYFVLSGDNSDPKKNQQEISIPPAVPDPKPELESTSEPAPIQRIESISADDELLASEKEPQGKIFTLPHLDESDQLVRDGVIALSRHEAINAWLAPNELVRKFVAVVDNIARGQVAREPIGYLAPEGAFLVVRIDDHSYTLDPVSYRRFDVFTEIVISFDTRRSVELLEFLNPLFQKAYGELGYGEAAFEDVLITALDNLLETPVLEAPIRLKRPVVMFEFEDPDLESLNPVQKQLIRMGPRNTRLLQMKIREFLAEFRAVP